MVQVGSRPAATAPRSTTADQPLVAPASPDADAERRPRRYSVEIPVDPSLLPFVGLMLVALVFRVWDLGGKALHHDESLHALYSWYLYQGRGYFHDPMMHGPLLFIGNALAYVVLGASDFSSRIVPALLGVVLVGMPWLVRNELGRWGAVAAAIFFTISPTFLYFSRFIRHDIYVDVFTLLMVIGVFRYLASGNKAWFQASVVGAALLFATKEDFYISGVIPFTFLVGCWFLLRGERRALYHARVRALGWQSWALGVVVFLAINAVLYTTFFTNMKGLCTALWAPSQTLCGSSKGALQYWLEQQDVARGGQPWFYYWMLLPLYELLPHIVAAVALFAVRRRNLFWWFCGYWFLGAMAIYSWAGEKMPWMLPQMALPLVLFGSKLLGEWAEAGWGRRALSPRGLAVAGLVLFAGLSFVAWLGLSAANTMVPLDQQTVTLQRLALSAAIAATVGAILTLGGRWGRRYVLPGLALGVAAIAGAAYVRTSLLVNYVHPDTPNEPLIYVQSSPDITWTAREIERIAAQTGLGKNVGILMDNGWGDGVHESVAWPFEWYLRDYKNKLYYTRTINPNTNLADYPILLAMAPNVDPIQEQLKDYSGQKYHLNWWFPEDYKDFATTVRLGPIPLPGLRLGEIAQTLSRPEHRVKLLKFILYREPPNTLAGREYYFYVHNSVPRFGPVAASGVGGASTTARVGQAPAPRDAVAQPGPDGSTVLGRSAAGTSVLVDPKNAAQGPDGRVYVVEGRPGRVTIFNPDGTIQRSFGSPGQGDGQFQEPWGVAVGPNGHVYVADTWNHRIQRFTPDGVFVGKWGRLGEAKNGPDQDPGVFWGPRAIAFGGDEVYVTDTGNKRVQVFDLDGRFRRAFGTEGTGPGQFREPVGVTVDRDGSLWVADAWNGRVQHLDRNGAFLGAFNVPSGWESQSITNKPYLASGPAGLLATFPDSGRLELLRPDGGQVRQWQVPPGGSAVGTAWTPDGRILVADARSGIILLYPAP